MATPRNQMRNRSSDGPEAESRTADTTGAKADAGGESHSPEREHGITAPGRKAWSPVSVAHLVISRYSILLLLLGLIVLFSFLNSDFLTSANWSGLLATEAVSAAMAAAVLIPLIAGEFDLSVGYMIGVIVMLGAFLAGHNANTLEIVLAMIGAGLLVGAVNGALTVYLGINSFISTLGVGIILSGITLGVSNGAILYQGIPASLTNFGNNKFLGLSLGIILVIVLGLILIYLLEHTPFGRRLYATGASEQVARLAGVSTRRLKLAAFCMAGFLVSMGGIIQLAQAGTASPSFGPDLMLPAYAAVFLGVTAYRPGYFNVVGTYIALLLLDVGFDGLSLIGVPTWGQPVFNGGILLIAVLLSRREGRTVQVG